ncbi:MAG: hypothetical protein JSV09_09515 [Thermoplasmata archaeon]|nr:MAG: hypothetical protein JSV09_09515 [Thermoplasmata archaeon]
MKKPRYFRCSIPVIIVLGMLIFSTLSFRINVVHHAAAGKYGNIVPTTFELELLDKINENRSENSAGPLKLNTTLWWVARAHSQDMIDYDFFDHSSSEEGQFSGASFSQRVRTYAEYGNSYIGECIAWNSWGIDVEWCMSAWKNSPSHWDIIINPNFREIGLGVLQGEWDGWPSSALYTADFGGASISVDLSVDEIDIDFDPLSPSERQEVNITADIHNLGNTDAFPVYVKFFDGDPDSRGIQIGSEQQIPHILIHGESASVNVPWDTTGKPGSHDIYVVVDDGDLISESDEGNNMAFKSVVVNGSSPPPTNPPIHLDEGWNLVSFPYIVSDTSLENVLDSIQGEYDIIQCFDSSDDLDPWKQFNVLKPPHMNDLHGLDNGIGFWIHIIDSDGADLIVDGESPTLPQYVPMKRGWNLVGYPSSTQNLRNNALNNLAYGVEIDSIEYFDSITETIKGLEEGDYMEPGHGYWIHATQDCTWILDNPT